MLKCITGTKKNSKELVASAPNLRPLDPKNSSHVEAGIRYQDYLLGIMIPDVVLDTPNPNLTTLTEEEISYINGTVDAWAFDLYVAQFVYPLEGGIKACEANSSHPLWPTCVAAASTQENGWLVGTIQRLSNDRAAIGARAVRLCLEHLLSVEHYGDRVRIPTNRRLGAQPFGAAV
ncbi:hypothetical protein ACMFMF_006490 [Clarireedia jacksonii]